MMYESILESLVYYSPKFRDIIRKIDNPIAKDLLKHEGEHILPDITFIDISDDGVVTFSTMNNSIKKVSDFFKDYTDADFSSEWRKDDADNMYQYDRDGMGPGVYTSSRNTIKIGKLVNKILRTKYKDSDLEQFVNLVKAALEGKQEFSLISGNDINYAYDVNNYLNRTGTMGMSCMNNKDFLDLYTLNTDVCQLLVLKEMNKVIGRALVWKLNSIVDKNSNKKLNIKFYMDRVYTSDDYLLYKFHEHAIKNGWCYKAENNFSSKDKIIFEKVSYRVKMEVKVKPGRYGVYPYMDTFTRLDINTGTLYNDDDDRKVGSILRSTQGVKSSENYPRFPRIQRFKDFLDTHWRF